MERLGSKAVAETPAPVSHPVRAAFVTAAGLGTQMRLMVFAGVTLVSLGALSAALLL